MYQLIQNNKIIFEHTDENIFKEFCKGQTGIVQFVCDKGISEDFFSYE